MNRKLLNNVINVVAVAVTVWIGYAWFTGKFSSDPLASEMLFIIGLPVFIIIAILFLKKMA